MTDAEHTAALKRINDLIRRKRPTREELAELDQLADKVAAYEQQRWPIIAPGTL